MQLKEGQLVATFTDGTISTTLIPFLTPPQTRTMKIMEYPPGPINGSLVSAKEFTLPFDSVTKMTIKVTIINGNAAKPASLFLNDKNGTRIKTWVAPPSGSASTDILPGGGDLPSGKFTIGAELTTGMWFDANIEVNATCRSNISPFVNISRFGSGNNNKRIILLVIILLALFYYLYSQGLIKITKF